MTAPNHADSCPRSRTSSLGFLPAARGPSSRWRQQAQPLSDRSDSAAFQRKNASRSAAPAAHAPGGTWLLRWPTLPRPLRRGPPAALRTMMGASGLGLIATPANRLRACCLRRSCSDGRHGCAHPMRAALGDKCAPCHAHGQRPWFEAFASAFGLRFGLQRGPARRFARWRSKVARVGLLVHLNPAGGLPQRVGLRCPSVRVADGSAAASCRSPSTPNIGSDLAAVTRTCRNFLRNSIAQERLFLCPPGSVHAAPGQLSARAAVPGSIGASVFAALPSLTPSCSHHVASFPHFGESHQRAGCMRFASSERLTC